MMSMSPSSVVPAAWQKLAASCDPGRNRDIWLGGELAGVAPDDVHLTWANFHLAVHGTTVDRAVQAITDGKLFSLASLSSVHPEVAKNRLQNATDQLDIKLGLDKFVFLNVGRVHQISVREVYFLFPNSMSRRLGALVSLREIVHFGALVSPEAVAARSREMGRRIDADSINFEAARNYFENVFSGGDFTEQIFPRFLQKYYPNMGKFSIDLLYPGQELRKHQNGAEVTFNAYEGPQLQVPGEISFADSAPSILVTSRDVRCLRQVRESGFPADRIYHMDEVIELYRKRYNLKPYGTPLENGLYVNLALRDLALLPWHNPSGQGYPESMTGFVSRL